MELILMGLGFALTTFCAFAWMGLPFFVMGLLRRRKGVVQKLSVFSLSSVPAIMESRTVYEFIQSLKDEGKVGAYNAVMGNMRRLLLDIKKHRQSYPAEIEALKTFVLSQLRYNIEHSPACGSLETPRFRDLAEIFVLAEVMQNIYMADCKASRDAAARNIRLP